MRRFEKWAEAVCICLLTASLCGCGEQAETDSVKGSGAVVSMEGTPIVDYSVPQLLPNILVDRKGYTLECEKRAAVKGRELPDGFRLIDAKTGETVYSGSLEKITYNAELGIYTGYAIFDDFATEGTYYLECDIIGRSYRFDIYGQMYRTLFLETYVGLLEACRDRTLSSSEAFALLAAYEWYGDIFPDGDQDGIPDVLKELQGWVAFMEESESDTQKGALYASFLAKFGYNYQKYDQQYATDCLRRASTVFSQVQTTIGKDADSFLALTELYRATGLFTYRNQISDYKSFFENNGSYLEETEYLYGIMTYMATRQKVDVELCEIFMNHLMTRGEEISKRYGDMIHPVTARNNGAEELLKRAVELSCVNYVLNSYQYTNIVEDFLHYLMGQNIESVCFYPEEGNRVSYLFLFAQLAEIHMEEE